MTDPLATFLGVLPQMPERTVLRLLLETGIELIGAEEGSLLVYDPAANDLQFALTVGDEESAKKLLGQKVPISQGITGLAAATREVQIGAPTFRDIRQTEKRGGDEGAPEAVIAAPMVVADALVGVITAVSFRPGKRFGAADGRLYARYAAIAGLVVDQRRRLTSVENRDTQALSAGALSETGRHERRILEAIGRIVTDDPGALPHVAQILASIAALLGARR